MFKRRSPLVFNMSPPCRSSDVFGAGWVGKQVLDLFERLTGGLGEYEENMNKHTRTERAEDLVGSLLDIDKRWRNKVTQCEVESPVGGCGESHGLTTYAEGE